MNRAHIVILWLSYTTYTAFGLLTTQFSVESGVSFPDGVVTWTTMRSFNTPTRSICSLACLGNTSCRAALHNGQSMTCHLYPCLPYSRVTEEEYSLLLKKKENETTGANCLYKDCQDVFDNSDVVQNGVYALKPSETQDTVIYAMCQFDSTSGWTVIQRRLDGSVDFDRNWDDYSAGFGDSSGEHWIGLDAIHWLSQRNQRLSIYLEAHDGESRTANYSAFYVDGSVNKYMLQISGYSGDAGDSLTDLIDCNYGMANNRKFSTKDSDNDASAATHCAKRDKGGGWFASCKCAHLNGVMYENGVAPSATSNAAYWKSWKGGNYSYKKICMRVST